MIEVFKKEYSGESIVDLERDISEALDDAFNPVIDRIPVDDYGFLKGNFTVAIVWSEQKSAPDSNALLEAIAELCDEIDKHEIHTTISETSILWLKRKARNALNAYYR